MGQFKTLAIDVMNLELEQIECCLKFCRPIRMGLKMNEKSFVCQECYAKLVGQLLMSLNKDSNMYKAILSISLTNNK